MPCMLPNKSHLQVIVKELERFEGDLEKNYNFQEFIDRCRAIFPPETQEKLDEKIFYFEDLHLIDVLTAQNILYKVRVEGLGGKYVIRIIKEEGEDERINLNLYALEMGLRSLIVWCRKQIIKLIRDEQVQFDKITDIDLQKG